MEINKKTNFITSISTKKSSLGYNMHNSAYKHLGLNFIYFETETKDCKNAINGIKAMNFRGSAVSMPYKREVMKYLDRIDPIAKKIGAVNTVLNKRGFLIGYNSDWIGAVESLKEITNLKNKIVVIIGAGGAARAIAYGLKRNKSKVIILNRAHKKAKKLARDFNLIYGGKLSDFNKIRDYDILINATSVGSYPHNKKSVIKEKDMKKDKIVMDVVFEPLETNFLKNAKMKNCRIIPGYKMLVLQALFQFKTWTSKKAPKKVMENSLLKILK